MKIQLAVFAVLLAIFSFPPCCACFAQTVGRDSGSKTTERAEFQRRVRAEIQRLKDARPNRYVENVDFEVDPAALKDKRVVVFGFGSSAAAVDGNFTFKIGDSWNSSPKIPVSFSSVSKEAKKRVLQANSDPHLWTVNGTWKYGATGGILIADEVRDFGEARLCSKLSDCLNESDASSIRAGQAERLSRVSAELQRLKTETPRRYVENADFAVDPQVYADKRVVAVGFGFFSSNRNGVFTVSIADSFGGSPSITADFSKLRRETKKVLLENTFPPHLLLIEGVWRKTDDGWRLFAEEARDLGEARCGNVLSDCLKAPEGSNRL